jgi:hypothetical protein
MDGKTGWGWMEETVPTVSVDTAGLSVLPSSSSSFFFGKIPTCRFGMPYPNDLKQKSWAYFPLRSKPENNKPGHPNTA